MTGPPFGGTITGTGRYLKEVSGGRVITRPIKGTRPRGPGTPAQQNTGMPRSTHLA